MKPDISNRNDIELLINTFYQKVQNNDILGYIFSDIAKVNWEAHLPTMYAFWASVLLDERSYTGNPMTKHIALSKITNLTSLEFTEWLKIFKATVDGLFEGTKADEAKFRAENIANLMQYKIEQNTM
jgi:hemoglobin